MLTSMHHMKCIVKLVPCMNKKIEEDLLWISLKELLLYLLETKSRSLERQKREVQCLTPHFFFHGRYDKAIDMLRRQSVILQKFTSRSHLYKANLSILILIFAIGDDVEAGKQFSNMCG